MTDKRDELLTLLLRSSGPVSGEELAARLGVSSRTVRNYVRSLNRRVPVVAATHRGYVIDRRNYQDARSATLAGATDAPGERLRFICRDLPRRSEPISVYELADALFISESTLESDLTRVRDVFRQHDLVLRRERDLIWAEGKERSRRRLVRQMLQGTTEGLLTATWKAFSAEYSRFEPHALRDGIAAAVAASQLETNEYVIADLTMHLVITVERVRDGYVLPATDLPTGKRDHALSDLCARLGDLVSAQYGVVLPAAELNALYGVVAVRTVRGAREDAASSVVDPDVHRTVGEVMEDVSDQFLLGPSDPEMLLKLTLHVQNLVARARSGTSLVAPLGDEFKNGHPLLHDLALCFAGRLETQLGIVVSPGELDYLSFHMGLQHMRYIEERDLVTITLVAPQYYDVAERLASQLSDVLRGQAVIETVASTIDVDIASVTSDLIVSCVDPPGPSPAPVVRVSPFPTPQEIDQLLVGVREQRERNARRRVRTALTTLIDPRAFFHVEHVTSRDAALEMMCDALVHAGYVDHTFLRDVMERENRSSTSFGGEFALAHSMYMDARGTGISVLVSDKGIPWGRSLVRLVLLFALSPDGRATFRDVFEEITRLLASRSSTAALVAGSSGFDQFMTSLTDLIDGDSSGCRSVDRPGAPPD